MVEYVTSDIALAAYLMMKGVKLNSANRQGNKFIFSFDDKNNSANSLSIEYIASDFSKFDAAMRQLKRILYRN